MYYTQEQIDRANQADLVLFLQSQREPLERAGHDRLSLLLYRRLNRRPIPYHHLSKRRNQLVGCASFFWEGYPRGSPTQKKGKH